MGDRRRCTDCDHRYAVGKSPRCNICRRAHTKRQAHNRHLQKTYGITLDDYDAMYKAQGGGCAICGGGTSKNFLAVDHDHKTGMIRGLLCATCNQALRRFRDNKARFLHAYEYLDDPPAKPVLRHKAKDRKRWADKKHGGTQ